MLTRMDFRRVAEEVAVAFSRVVEVEETVTFTMVVPMEEVVAAGVVAEADLTEMVVVEVDLTEISRIIDPSMKTTVVVSKEIGMTTEKSKIRMGFAMKMEAEEDLTVEVVIEEVVHHGAEIVVAFVEAVVTMPVVVVVTKS